MENILDTFLFNLEDFIFEDENFPEKFFDIGATLTILYPDAAAYLYDQADDKTRLVAHHLHPENVSWCSNKEALIMGMLYPELRRCDEKMLACLLDEEITRKKGGDGE